jgi:glycosyltransferase involved in cell wall biosynthesis
MAVMSPSSPTISVIMPAYQAAEFIARSIRSAQAQTLRPLEILVIDDGSQDNTAEAAAACGDLVRVIRQANGGPAAARNMGAREARGEWLAFLDADDGWLPHKLERQAAQINPSISLVHTYCTVDENSRFAPEEQTFDSLWSKNTVCTSSVLLRKSEFETVGGFDADRSIMAVEDYNLWLRLLHRGCQFRVIREGLVEYTPAPNNLSGQFGRMVRSELNNVEKIRQVCGIDDQRVTLKQAAIYSEWGTALFHSRHLQEARDCYSNVLQRKPTLSALIRWMATFVPRPILDLRRGLATTR